MEKNWIPVIPIITAINIYNTMIKPHFIFGSTILYTCCSTTQIEILQRLQNKTMRSILKYNRYTPIQLMLETISNSEWFLTPYILYIKLKWEKLLVI